MIGQFSILHLVSNSNGTYVLRIKFSGAVYFFNGFKLMKKDVWPLFGQELQEMRQMIEADDLLTEQAGSLKELNGFPIYREYFLKYIKLERKLKVVLENIIGWKNS